MSEHRELLREGSSIGGSIATLLPGAPRRDPGGARPPSKRSQAALPLAAVGAGMRVCRLRVRPADVVFVKGVVEASDGLAGVFAERGGDLVLAAPPGRDGELLELVADLEAELGEEQ